MRPHARVLRLLPPAAAAWLILVTAASANSLKEVPVDSLWVHADCVIEANVLGHTSGYTPDSSGIHTWVQLDVTSVFAGPCLTGPHTLEFWAGVAPDSMAVIVENMPSFEAGEHVFLFLSTYPGVVCPVLGLDMGKFTVSVDLATGRERIHNAHYGALTRSAILGAARARRGR